MSRDMATSMIVVRLNLKMSKLGRCIAVISLLCAFTTNLILRIV